MTGSTLPLTVLGGYLGSGKTTLLNHLLTQADGIRVAVLVNDFGEVNIDAALITGHDGDTISLSNGCMCCKMADGFAAAIAEILKQANRFDHVIVEASGVAEPGKIAQTGQAFGLKVDGVLVVVDAEQVRNQAANITRAVLSSQAALPQTRQIFAISRRKCIDIGFIHRIVFALIGHFHIFVAEYIGANTRVQRKSINTAPGSIYKYRR